MRHNDDYFLKTTIKAFENILKETKNAALRLQKKYYDCMEEVLIASKMDDGSDLQRTCYRHFLMKVSNMLTQDNDFYFIKF